MDNKETLVNIIIPTRDRLQTLIYTLQSVLEDKYKNMKVIVVDNASSDKTKDYIKKIKDKRLSYFNTNKTISMSHNWEFALQKVSEGYVTILGSDDGHIPGTCSILNDIVKKYNPEALMSKECFYIWPSEEFPNGYLNVASTKGIEWRNSKKWLNKFINGFVDIAQLPTLYAGGFIKVSLIKKIIDNSKSKNFFHSCIPDVYSAVAICSSTDKFLYSHTPLGITGVSKFSNGVSANKMETLVKDSPSNDFYKYKNIPFHPNILLIEGVIPQLVHAYRLEAFFQTDFLRTKINCYGKSFWKRNITILIGEAILEQRLYFFEKWFKELSKIHFVSFEKVKKLAYLYYFFVKFKNLKRSYLDNIYSITPNLKKKPCPNVYIASILARKLKFDKPINKTYKTIKWMARIFPALKKVVLNNDS